jgi:alpha-tubulin suppressor-like RCC1 family protein
VLVGEDGYGATKPPLDAFQQVAAGFGHACGIKSDGTITCWGSDDDGEATPPSGTFQQLALGADHSCGVRTDATVACWDRTARDDSARNGP